MSIDPMISVEGLQDRLGSPGVKLLDATWAMPNSGRDYRGEYLTEHLPGAVHFDIDAVADPNTALPHMLPAPERFAALAGELGVGSDDLVVVYDRPDIPSAARVWWMFRAMGHEAVKVLDGGLKAWRDAGGAVESGRPAPAPAAFGARLQPNAVRDFAQVRAALDTSGVQVVDARPAPRFRGEVPEPRAGLKSGHMPGALGLPAGQIYDAAGRLKSRDALHALLAAAGVAPGASVIATCGSGVTACSIALALARLGRDDVAIYDGSWSEWGARDDAPVTTGG